jgi:hypothetical protein
VNRPLPLTLAMSACTACAQGYPATPEAVVQAWADAFNGCGAEKLAALYDPRATLWGTQSASLTTSAEGVRAYFDLACAASPPIKVTVGQIVSRMHGTVATVSGTYEFSRGGTVFPARYSFALVGEAGGWRIVQHHSSPLPGRP